MRAFSWRRNASMAVVQGLQAADYLATSVDPLMQALQSKSQLAASLNEGARAWVLCADGKL